MKKVLYEEAEKRFRDQGRLDLRLMKEFYLGWKKKAIFFDFIQQENFVAIPKNVFYNKSCHPKRTIEERKQTNILKYGNASSLHGNTPAALEVQQKIKTTWFEKYGETHQSKSKETRQKVIKTVQKNYGVDNISQLKKKTVSITGEFVQSWFDRQPDPKPCSYQSFGALFLFGPNSPLEFSQENLKGFLTQYACHKTKLETLGESIFQVPHFNQKAHETLKYRPDFKLNDHYFVNVDGLYWHSEKQKPKTYHWDLRCEFNKIGLSICQFREDEIRDKPEIVKSMINNKLGRTQNKIYARNTIVGLVTQKQADIFLKASHLMGSIKAKHLGLYTKNTNKLVSVLSYKTFLSRSLDDGSDGVSYKIERFCSEINTSMVGGFSKLLKSLEKILPSSVKEIHYWTDLRYGIGLHLMSLGFVKKKETLGWKWTDGQVTYNRLMCKANMDSRKLSEKEHAEELGWFRIYDAGQRLYVKQIGGS